MDVVVGEVTQQKNLTVCCAVTALKCQPWLLMLYEGSAPGPKLIRRRGLTT